MGILVIRIMVFWGLYRGPLSRETAIYGGYVCRFRGSSKGLFVSKGSHVTHPSASLDGDLFRDQAQRGAGFRVLGCSRF